MNIRYIFNTFGKYVAFTINDYIFSSDGEWLGVIRPGYEVYSTSGEFIGHISSDDRIIKSRDGSQKMSITKPLPPRKLPEVPNKPLRRLRMPELPHPYEDVFEKSSVWQDKTKREHWEIQEFIKHYKRLPHGRSFEIHQRLDEHKSGPDYLVRDISTDELFGVELTSVYSDDKSVLRNHINHREGMRSIPYDPQEIKKYMQRVLDRIAQKVTAARSNYDTSFPLIMSIYINEYLSIYISDKDWISFFNENEKFFDSISPFQEIVLWPLPSPDATESIALSGKPTL